MKAIYLYCAYTMKYQWDNCTLISKSRRFKHGLPKTRASQARDDPPGQ